MNTKWICLLNSMELVCDGWFRVSRRISRGFAVCGILAGALGAATAARGAWIVGEVCSEATGRPISNAWVRVASPAMDLRSVREPQRGIYDGRTDGSGRFRIQVEPHAKISINAFAPGFEEAAGLLMSGNFTFHDIPYAAATTPEFKIQLKPALHVAGTIRDESDRPVAAVQVTATLADASSTAYVCFDTTRSDGRFEIHDFPLTRPGSKVHGRLAFAHDTHPTVFVPDVYALNASQRTNLTIKVSAGERIRGVVSAPDGKLLAGAIVEAVPTSDEAARRKVITDEEGRYDLRGLVTGEVVLIARTEDFGLKTEKRLVLKGREIEVPLRLESVVPAPAGGREFTLFGMKLADVNRDLKKIYNLDDVRGVVILDPGSSYRRLEIGTLEPGYVFWMVGNQVVRNLREMVHEILRVESIAPPGDPNEGCRGSVRVVYVYRNRQGTNTQRLRLRPEDIEELKRLEASLRR